MFIFSVINFSMSSLAVLAFPVQFEAETLQQLRPWEQDSVHGGDIRILQHRGIGYNTAKSNIFQWPGGLIYYRIAPSLESSQALIESAMRHIENKTCIRFRKQDNERNYINIMSDDKCSSSVGKIGNVQPLTLSEGCLNIGTILHELSHAIGFYHEHTRFDRDNYVEINRDNIIKGKTGEFEKMTLFEYWPVNTFDYDSIMMYGTLAFSKDNASPTIRPKESGIQLLELSEKTGLSDSDVFRINQLYNCGTGN